MNTIKTQKYEKITEELIASGYNKKEIDKVID
jgi:microsomal dipeptidase-like Zn-dependent dipeptidase